MNIIRNIINIMRRKINLNITNNILDVITWN